MISKKELLSRISELQNEVSAFKSEIPINGGNAYTQLEAFKAIYESNFSNANDVVNPFNQYNEFFQLVQASNYFSGLNPLSAESDIVILKKWPLIWQMAFLFGVIAVQVVNKELIKLFTIHEIKKNESTGQIISISGSNLDKWDGSEFSSIADLNQKLGIEPIDPSNTMLVRGHINGWNAWITWKPYFNGLNELFNRVNFISILELNKLVIESVADNPEEKARIIKDILNPKTFISKTAIVDSNGRMMPNRTNIETLDLGQSNLKEYMEFIDWYNNYWYTILGKTVNTNKKRERNVKIEAEISNKVFVALDAFLKTEAIILIKWLETHGINAKLLEVEKEEKEQEQLNNKQGFNNAKNN